MMFHTHMLLLVLLMMILLREPLLEYKLDWIQSTHILPS